MHETIYDEMAREFSLRVGRRAVCGCVQGFPLAVLQTVGGGETVSVAMSPDGLSGVEGLIPRIRKAYGIAEIHAGESSAAFSFRHSHKPIRRIGEFLRQELPEFAAHGWNREFVCPHCRKAVRESAEYRMIGTELFVLHPHCAEPHERAAREAWEAERARAARRGNPVRGFVGALLGALLGAVLWFGALLLLSRITAVSDGLDELLVLAYGIFIVLGAHVGHDLFRGGEGRGRTVRVAVAAGAAVCGVSVLFAASSRQPGAPMFTRQFWTILASMLSLGGLATWLGFSELFGGSPGEDAFEVSHLSI